MKSYLTYKFLIKPNKAQKAAIKRLLDDVSLVRKLYLDDLKTKGFPKKQLKDLVAEYVDNNERLKNSDFSALLNELFTLSDFNNDYLLSDNLKKKCFSYRTTFLRSSKAVRFVSDDVLYLPKVGNVKIIMHRQIDKEWKLKNCGVVYNRDNNYHVCISVEKNAVEDELDLDNEKIIGLDYSNKNFLVDDKGNRYNVSHFYRDNDKRLANLQSAMSNCKYGSNNYYDLKHKIAKQYTRIKNRRRDELHKISRKLVKDYDIICIEDLDMIEISGSFKLGKSTMDNAFGMFVNMLDYKCKLEGKRLIKIDRWYPSSKLCSKCGFINKNLDLSTRSWICPECNTWLDRDINAATNIRNEGRRIAVG